MSFSRYWRERIAESFMNAYRWAQLAGFIILLIVAVLVWRWPLFPYDKLVVWLTAGCFFFYLSKEVCFVSPYRHAEKLQSELDSLNNAISKRREEQSNQVVEKAFALLKRPESRLQPFQALYVAGAADLETNDQVVSVANKLSEHHDHPLRWMQPYVLEGEWLQFLQWGKYHPDLKLDTGDYLEAVIAWAVKHNTGTEESISAEIIRGMSADQDNNEITSSNR
jgi:hypothetical protein